MLSLPMFAIMPRSVYRGFVGLSPPKGDGSAVLTNSSSTRPYMILALNLLSQLICVAGVNQLSSVCTFFPPPLCSPRLARPSFSVAAIPHSLSQSKTTDLSRSLDPHSPFGQLIYPLIQSFLLLESVRGVDTSRTHGAQGN